MTDTPIVPGEQPSLRHRVRAALTEHLDIKALALGLAVLLWLFVALRAPATPEVPVRAEPVSHAGTRPAATR